MGEDCLPCRDDELGAAVQTVINDLRLPLHQALARSVGGIYPGFDAPLDATPGA